MSKMEKEMVFKKNLDEYVLKFGEIVYDDDEEGHYYETVKDVPELISGFAENMEADGYDYQEAYNYAADREDYIYELVLDSYHEERDYEDAKHSAIYG